MLKMLNSFHDQEREEGASALSFFSSGEGVQTKIAKDRRATTSLRFVSFAMSRNFFSSCSSRFVKCFGCVMGLHGI